MNSFEHYLYPPITNINFPIYMEKQEYHQSGSLFPIHWHEQLELIYILEGDFYMHTHHEEIVGQAGDLILINPNEIHHVLSHSKYTSYYCVIIDPILLKGSSCDICDTKYYSHIWNATLQFNNKINNPTTMEFFKKIVQENNTQKKGYEMVIKGYCHLLLASLYQTSIRNPINSSNLTTLKKKSSYVEYTLNYIHHHFAQPLSISELSQKQSISNYYLCHIFKEVTGTTINQYHIQFRLQKAAYLLKTTDKNITEIAIETGFCDSNYFSRTFKKAFHQTPLDFRKIVTV